MIIRLAVISIQFLVARVLGCRAVVARGSGRRYLRLDYARRVGVARRSFGQNTARRRPGSGKR